MKFDRLLGILTVLLQQNKITAPELAERFDVSRRTINRDIEDLCKAGIPVVTEQGFGGGISIAEGYRLDRTVFTAEELQAILIGLRSLDTVAFPAEHALHKLQPAEQDDRIEPVQVDLASFYRGSLTDKIAGIHKAILERKILSFRYYSAAGEGMRKAEPYQLVFQWGAWYLFGFCLETETFRLFKLNRLWELTQTERTFTAREIPEQKKDFHGIFTDEIKVTARFQPNTAYRLIDEYGPDSFQRQDGFLLFEQYFTNWEYLVSWMLGFGDAVEVIDPPELREALKQQAEGLFKLYGQT